MPAAKKRKLDLSGDELFEKAYSYYRKNENAKALKEIAKADENEIRFMELKAQLLYRLERCEEALELFNRISSTHSDDFDDTRRANVIAVYALMEAKKSAASEQSENGRRELPLKAETFEQMYNAACFLVGQENFGDAIKLLDKATVKCRETLTEDGFTEEEILEELSVILAQKAYALQRSGLVEEALKLYKSIQESNIADANAKATVLNNVLSIEKVPTDTEKLRTARRDLKNISEKSRWKLSKIQKAAVISNLEVLQSKNMLAAAAAAAGKEEVFQEIVTGKLGARKRKRKPRLPKNFDPNVPPDPERWLPRQERSAYKKKLNKKFKDRDISRGTQGSSAAIPPVASSSIQPNLDIKQGSSSVEQSPKPTEGPRQQRPAAPKKAKKKKGGKW